MVRAREAAIAINNWYDARIKAQYRSGAFDSYDAVRAAVEALRKLPTPISELVPDPDKEEAKKLAKKYLDAPIPTGPQDLAAWAIKRGRELEREGK